MAKEGGPEIDFRTYSEYWDSHMPDDNCTLEPQQFKIIELAGVNPDTSDNMERVNSIVSAFVKNPTEPIRAVDDSNLLNTILPIANLTRGSLIGLTSEVLEIDFKGNKEYSLRYEHGVVQEENTRERARYVHLIGRNGVHYRYPGNDIHVGNVEHLKIDTPFSETWTLRRVVKAELLSFAKHDAKTVSEITRAHELKKGVISRIFRR